MPVIFLLNAVNFAFIPVKRGERHFFFRLNAINDAIFPVKRH